MSADPLALFAQLNITEHVFLGIRFIAGVLGGLCGWYASGPPAKLVYRVRHQRPIPGWLLPWYRMLGALILGLLAFYLLPLGAGGLGLGWGPGRGGGPGKGAGEGGSTAPSSDPPVKAENTKSGRPRPRFARAEAIEIELLGGKNYADDGRYYLVGRSGPPKTLDELRDIMHEQRDKIEVHIILTERSIAPGHGAVLRLRSLLDAEGIPNVQVIDAESDQRDKATR
jgi:hypothetical protein